MSVIIAVESTNGEVIKTKKLKNLEKNIYAEARKLVGKWFTTGFGHYYKYHREIYSDDTFPYIVKNGIYEWHVPVKDVTIREFMNTHNIETNGTIYINELGIGRGDFSYVNEIIQWFPVIWTYASTILTAAEITKIVLSFYHTLIGKDKKPLLPSEIIELLETKERWTIGEIRNATHCKDDFALEALLLTTGYKKNRQDGTYYKDQKGMRDEDDENQFVFLPEENEACWGEIVSGDDESYFLTASVYELNRALTSLKVQSDYYNTGIFDLTIKKIYEYTEETDGLLYRGNDFQYVKVNTEKIDSNSEIQRQIEEDLWEFQEKIYTECGILDGVIKE